MNFKQHKVVIAVASAITLGLGSVAIAASVNPSKTVSDMFTSNVPLITDRGNPRQQQSHNMASEILSMFKDGRTDEQVFGDEAAADLHNIVGDNTEMNEIIPFAVPDDWAGGDQEFTMGFDTFYPEGTVVAITITYFDSETGQLMTIVIEAVANADGTITFTVPADVMQACQSGFGFDGGASLAVFNAEGALA